MKKIIIKKSVVLATIILLVCNTSISAQNYADFHSAVIPPSPTSEVFRKYGMHQPSLSSGTVNIPIPLFEINSGGFSLPFTLLYNTSGISVFDRPFPCGYGWVFSPGLRITRTIFGRPDELYTHYPLGTSYNGPNDDLMFLKRGIISDEKYYPSHGLNLSDLFDTQHDIYTIHLPSGNYTFLLEKEGNKYVGVTCNNLLKIEYQNTSGLNMFQVIDEKGVIYKFGDTSTSNVVDNSYEYTDGGFSPPTAWMLKEVILPNGETLTFTWKHFMTNHIYAPFQSSLPIDIKDFKGFSCSGYYTPELLEIGGVATGNVNYHTLMLEKVEFPSGTVTITYKANDVNPFMTKFEVKDKSGRIVKNVALEYGTENENERALLKTLSINQEVYKFYYNSQRYSKNSTALDYWGYYNGKTSNPNLIPKLRLALYGYCAMLDRGPDTRQELGYADRSVNAGCMKAYMLEKIEYPTKGYSEFEYEAHQFNDQYPISVNAFAVTPDPINTGGGLRVSKITTKADGNAQPTIKIYKYGNNENGKANIQFVPTLDTFLDEYCIFEFFDCTNPLGERESNRTTYRSLSINPFSNYSKYLISNAPLWYDKVTEYINDTLKTEYYFNYEADDKGYINLYKLVRKPHSLHYLSLFENGPRMKEQIMYKKAGQSYTPAQRTLFNYKRISGDIVNNWIIERTAINKVYESGNAIYDDIGPDFLSLEKAYGNGGWCVGSAGYTVYPYQIMLNYYTIENKQVINMTDNNVEISTLEEYQYNYPQQLKKLTQSTSIDSRKRIIEYKYPSDYVTTPYTSMVNKNILSPVIEEITYNSSSEIKRVKTNYTNNTSVTTGLILPETVQVAPTGGTGNLQAEITYNKYDTKGNPLWATLKDNTSIVYLWGYNGQYPVAEIRNATYSQVEDILKSALISRVASANEPAANDLTTIKNLRTNADLSKAMVTVYEYRPLVGILKMTDPRGIVTDYVYDDFGRLKQVLVDGKKEKDYQYHYKE